jgi:hypothetical protein
MNKNNSPLPWRTESMIAQTVNDYPALLEALKNLCIAVEESGAHQQSTHVHTRLGQARAVIAAATEAGQ